MGVQAVTRARWFLRCQGGRVVVSIFPTAFKALHSGCVPPGLLQRNMLEEEPKQGVRERSHGLQQGNDYEH